MLKEINELAENKLIILYVINAFNGSISRSHFTQVILESNIMNYFVLQQYLSELLDSEFIDDVEVDKKHVISLTKKGNEAYTFFKSRINEKRRAIIDTYIEKHITLASEEISATSMYTSDISGSYSVTLILKSSSQVVMNTKIVVNTEEEAKNISARWDKDYKLIFSKFLNLFDNKKQS